MLQPRHLFEAVRPAKLAAVKISQLAVYSLVGSPQDKAVVDNRQQTMQAINNQRELAHTDHPDPEAVIELGSLAAFMAVHGPKNANELDEQVQAQAEPANVPAMRYLLLQLGITGKTNRPL